ncbi:MAG: hypothetical protein R3F37_00735 [Candidatus Competibacteraceae bacterium]
MLSLINDLLDYSKLEINTLKLENATFALSPLLNMLKETLQLWAGWSATGAVLSGARRFAPNTCRATPCVCGRCC